jgi:hypothetical protein
MPSQREQYGNIVHLFIGTGRSPCKITSRPFAFDNNSIVIYMGLDSLFLFKSVSSFLPSRRSSLAHSFGSVPSFIFFSCFFILWVLVRRSLSTHYTPETLLNHVFEDLRKPKAPNNYRNRLICRVSQALGKEYSVNCTSATAFLPNVECIMWALGKKSRCDGDK